MNGKDDYGNSLIAILVNRFGKLSDATLRCNHVGISGSADNQYNSYSELSKVVGFNVEEEILKHGFEEFSVEGLFEVDGGVITKVGDDTEAYHSIVEYTIPNGTRTIVDYTFADCYSLKKIVVPNGVMSIGAYAFGNCSSLENIDLPNSVERLGNGALYNCRSLTSIKLSNSLTSIEDFTFFNCSSLTSITIPNSVKRIGYGAFEYCSKLTNVVIPSSVKEIDIEAFACCGSLTNVTIPNSVTNIGPYAFTECGPNLTVLTDNEYVKEYCDFKGIKCVPLSHMNESVDKNGVAYRGHNKVYGNTLTGDIGFHFGTEKAAKEREQSYRRSKQGKSSKDIQWVINKYNINCSDLLTLDDNGGFNWLLVLEQLIKLDEFKDSKDLAKIIKYAKANFKDDANVGVDISKLKDYDYYNYFVNKYPQSLEYSSEIHKLLRNLLKKKGYNGIKYKNNTEDKGSVSYCIFDEKDVQLVKDETPAPNLRDIK